MFQQDRPVLFEPKFVLNNHARKRSLGIQKDSGTSMRAQYLKTRLDLFWETVTYLEVVMIPWIN